MARYIKDNFYGWMSEDDVLGWADRCLFSNWIDVTWNSNFIQLMNAPVEAIDTWSELWQYAMTVSSSTFAVQPNVLMFTDSWIYRDDTVGVINASVWQEANFVVWDTMYLVQNNWNSAVFTLYSEPVDNMLTSWSPVPSVVTTVGALSTNDSYFNNWVTVLWDIAYIWLGDKVCRFEPTNANTITEFDIFGEEVIFVSYVWGYFRVYTRTWKLMLWDWNTTTIAESIDLKLPLKAWYQIWNIDYLYTWYVGNQRGLYYMSGYDLVPLFKEQYSNQLSAQKFQFDTINDKTPLANYWPTLFWHTDNDNTERGFKFWKDIEWLPNAYTELPKYSSYGLEYTAIRSFTVMWDYLFYAFNDWTNKWVDKINISTSNNTKTSEWTIITNVNPLWAWLYKKTSKYIYFKVWDIDADRTIEALISFDWGVYTSLWIVNEQPLDNIARLPVQWDLRDYSIKFILRATVSTSRSPKLYYWFAFDYEQHEI